MKLTPALVLCAIPLAAQQVCNVKDYGATGRRQDEARAAIQQAIDTCGKAGGGMVYVPPGE